MNINDTRIFQNIPEDIYHAEGRSGAWLQSHALALFAKSPAAYDRMRRGAAGAKDEPTEAFAFGRAAHCYILEGPDEFFQRFTTDEARPVNPKTGKPFGTATKEYANWAASLAPREIVSAGDMETIRAMAAAVARHPIAGDLLTGGRAEATVRQRYADMNCQIRMDYYSREKGIADLKTTRNLDRFEWDALDYGYINQLAFYRAVLRVATGAEATVRIVAVEKAEPFRCGVWRIPGWALDRAEKENEGRMRRLLECIELDIWPEPDEWEAERMLDFRK